MIFPDWRPRKMQHEDLGLPGSESRSLIPRRPNKGCATHIDFSGDSAWRFRMAIGCLCSMEETDGENADTSYRPEVLVEIPYADVGHAEEDPQSHVYDAIRTHSACAAIANSDSQIIGFPVVGCVGPNYSGHGLSKLEAWAKAGVHEWGRTSPGTTFSGDFEERAISWALRLTDNRR